MNARVTLTFGVALGLVALHLPASAVATEVEARELAQRAVAALPSTPFSAKITLTTPHGVRYLELKQKKREDGARLGYLEVVGPDDLAGIRHLFIEPTDGEPPQQYLKLTASRSIVRVSAETRAQPFLQSTFYIADLTEPPFDNYEYSFAGSVELHGRHCKLVEAKPKDPASDIYGKIIIAIDPKDNLVLRRQFFDKKGEALKTWQVEKLVKVQGILTPLVQDMRNLQEGTESRLETTELEYGADIPDSVFTPEHLKR